MRRLSPHEEVSVARELLVVCGQRFPQTFICELRVVFPEVGASGLPDDNGCSVPSSPFVHKYLGIEGKVGESIWNLETWVPRVPPVGD